MASNPLCESTLRLAVWQLFNADLPGAEALLRQHVASKPEDPLGLSLAAALPFYNFMAERLRSHYGNSLAGMILGESIDLPAGMRQLLGRNLQRSQTLAKRDLGLNSRDENALFALCVAEGVLRDIMALVFHRWTTSFTHAQTATLHARQLLSLNACAYDAYFIIGFSEHLIQKIPAIFRPFIEIPGIVGDNGRAIQFLEAAAKGGCYFREFASQALLIVYSEEGRREDVLRTLDALAREFPGNEIYRAEWLRHTGASTSRSMMGRVAPK